MVLHQRTHPNLDVEGCFGCKIASQQFRVPSYMKAGGIDAASAHKAEVIKAVRNDKEGRLQRA